MPETMTTADYLKMYALPDLRERAEQAWRQRNELDRLARERSTDGGIVWALVAERESIEQNGKSEAYHHAIAAIEVALRHAGEEE